MVKIIIYTQSNCRLSEKTRQLVQSNNLNYIEKDITGNVLIKREMIERTGGRSITPQVFVNGQYIGGYNELLKSEFFSSISR